MALTWWGAAFLTGVLSLDGGCGPPPMPCKTSLDCLNPATPICDALQGVCIPGPDLSTPPAAADASTD